MEGYTALAPFYDRFVGADYQQIIDFIDCKIKKYNPKISLVCDIGCGSGTVTLALLERGYDMIGVDGSFDMLNEAMNKRSEVAGGEKALFLCQELPDFELYGTVGAIISTLDTLNYVTDEKALDRLFYWFRNYLDPDGLLIFDINTLYKYQHILNNNCDIYDDDEVFMAWRSRFDGVICNHELSFFQKDNDCYWREDENQTQRYYSIDEIKALLEKYQFDILEIVDDYSEQIPKEETQRITFVAKVRKDS